MGAGQVGAGMQELVGDVGEDRGAAGLNAALGHQEGEASEVFAQMKNADCGR
jgi:hypothetical protein